MADGQTPNLALILPEIGFSFNTWGDKLHTNFNILDERVSEIKPAQMLGLAALGLLAVTADGEAYVSRIIAAGAGLGVENGNGSAGNPTVQFNLPGLEEKVLPVAADLVVVGDSADSFAPRKATRTQLLTGAIHTAGRLKYVNDGSGSGAVSLNLALGTYRTRQIQGSTTFTFAGAPATEGFGFVLELVNGGSAAITWPGTVKWPGGVAPAFTASGTDILVFLTRDGGATWRGTLVMSDSR